MVLGMVAGLIFRLSGVSDGACVLPMWCQCDLMAMHIVGTSHHRVCTQPALFTNSVFLCTPATNRYARCMLCFIYIHVTALYTCVCSSCIPCQLILLLSLFPPSVCCWFFSQTSPVFQVLFRDLCFCSVGHRDQHGRVWHTDMAACQDAHCLCSSHWHTPPDRVLTLRCVCAQSLQARDFCHPAAALAIVGSDPPPIPLYTQVQPYPP